MNQRQSTHVFSQSLDTLHEITTSRVPLSEIQNLRNSIHADTCKSKALLQSVKSRYVKAEDSVIPDTCSNFADVRFSTLSQSQSKGPTLRKRPNELQQQPQTTPIPHHDKSVTSQSHHHQVLSPQSSSPSKPSLSKSASTSNGRLSSPSSAKPHFSPNTGHSKPYWLQITRPRSRFLPSTRPRARASPVSFPDPHTEPPDSYAAARWRQVRARIATMDGPSTATTPSGTGTNASGSNSKLNQALKDLEIEHGVQCRTQFTTKISIEEATAIISKLGYSAKEGSSTLNLLSRIESAFFSQSKQLTSNAKPYETWTVHPPTYEQLVIHDDHSVDQESNTVSISFALAADETWNNQFLRGVPGLLRSAKVFDANMRCSQFLVVLVGATKLDVLHEQWTQQAEQELSKQLSVRRANACEDRWGVLTTIRYYGYLVSGLTLDIHEMVYRPDPSPATITIPPSQSQGRSGGFDTKESVSDTTAKLHYTKSGSRSNPKATPGTSSGKAPTLRSKTPSQTNSIAGATSRATSRGTATSGSEKYKEAEKEHQEYRPLTFTTAMIKSFSLGCKEDLVKFGEFHGAVMKWAQAQFCTGFVENLHQLCWQPSTEKTGLWTMTNKEMRHYWDSAAAPRP